MDRRRSSLVLVGGALLCVAALLAVALSGIISTKDATSKAQLAQACGHY